MALIPCNITQQVIMYNINIFGQTIMTTVTKYPAVVKHWIDRINAGGFSFRRYVGFAMEFDCGTHRIGTVQFCIGDQCLVFRLVDTQACPPFLKQFLLDNDRFSFVGIMMEGAIGLLDRQLGIGGPGVVRYIDLGEVDTMEKYNTLGSVAMGMVEWNWDRLNNLSDGQVAYASLDAFLNLHFMPAQFG